MLSIDATLNCQRLRMCLRTRRAYLKDHCWKAETYIEESRLFQQEHQKSQAVEWH